MARRAVARYALPFDTYERHAITAALVGYPDTLLDLGGRPGQLALFIPAAGITVLNVDRPADVIFEGSTLPFGDGSFDAVTSLDVLEHLPREQRASHLEELVRVARSRVVACCPLGTPQHLEAERELARQYPHPFLEEHLEHGLPTEDELRELAAELPFGFQLLFHGDFRRTNRLFRLTVEARRLRPAAAAHYAFSRLTFRPQLTLSPTSNPYTNRVFLLGPA